MQRAQIAELKAHLSKYLAKVRTGDIGDRVRPAHRPSARLVPYAEADDGFVVHRAHATGQSSPDDPRDQDQARGECSLRSCGTDATSGERLPRHQHRPARPAPTARAAGGLGGDGNRAYASELLHVEACRVIDRLRLEGVLDDHGIADAHEELVRIESVIANIPFVPIGRRARVPAHGHGWSRVSTPSAPCQRHALRERLRITLVFATHDPQQARAARARDSPASASDTYRARGMPRGQAARPPCPALLRRRADQSCARHRSASPGLGALHEIQELGDVVRDKSGP